MKKTSSHEPSEQVHQLMETMKKKNELLHCIKKEKKKMQVKEKVEFQLGRAEEETRRLAQVWEVIPRNLNPMRKEVTAVRKKIYMANRELRSLGQSCHKKEKEYREAMEVPHQKNDEKNQLTLTLVELVKESEKARMKKLEELNKILDPSG